MVLDKLAALSALAMDLHRACREAPVDLYQNWALDRLKAHVPFDSALWASGAFNKAGDPIVHNLVLVNRPLEMMQDYEKIKIHDLLARRNVANQGKAVFANSVDSNPEWHADAHAYLLKWRVSHALACITVDPLTRLSTVISVYRDPGGEPYREDERVLFEALMPHLIETYGMNRIAHMELAAHSKADRGHVSAVADRLGRLQIAPPAFQQLLLQEWPDWSGGDLPEPVGRQLAAKGYRLVGERITIKATPMNDVFLLQARARNGADTLSLREVEVARLVASGRTRKQTAQKLGIAPATVRNHMSAVFAKLGISKQSELASALHVLD